MKNIFYTFVVIMIVLNSCSEEDERKNKFYYSEVEIATLALPGTPEFDIRFNEQVLTSTGGTIPAGAPGTLGIYNKITGELLGDTVFTPQQNKRKQFKFAWSEETGIQGWINSQPVAGDTVVAQYLNALGSYYDAYPSLDLEVWSYRISTGEFLPTGIVIRDFTSTKLSTQRIAVPHDASLDPDEPPYFYYIKLVNVETGEYLLQPSTGFEYSNVPPVDGYRSYIFKVEDMAGDILITEIPL